VAKFEEMSRNLRGAAEDIWSPGRDIRFGRIRGCLSPFHHKYSWRGAEMQNCDI